MPCPAVALAKAGTQASDSNVYRRDSIAFISSKIERLQNDADYFNPALIWQGSDNKLSIPTGSWQVTGHFKCPLIYQPLVPFTLICFNVPMPKRVLTDADLKQIEELLDKNLDQRFDALEDLFDHKLDDRFDSFETKHINRYDEMITKLDGAIGKLQDSRNTQELHAQTHTDINNKLSKHEKRLKKLESLATAN